MGKQDILLKMSDGVFSYRVAGILLHNGKVLLQHSIHDADYAFPGGHVNFGEVSEAALVREFKEEVDADIQPERLLWIGENFFPWGENDCHQIGLYYLVVLCGEPQIPLDGCFFAHDDLGRERSDLEFCWVDVSALHDMTIYPLLAKEKLVQVSDQIERFVFIQNP